MQQLLTAPITRAFPLFLWTRQHSGSSVQLSCQLFDRLQGATVPMKVPVQVHVVVQPAGWDPAHYVLERAPRQNQHITHSNSSAPEGITAPGAEWEDLPAAALPTAAAGPGSISLGPFLAYVSRSKAGRVILVGMKHSGKLGCYRSVSGSPGAHDIVLFEQVCVCLCALNWLGLGDCEKVQEGCRPVDCFSACSPCTVAGGLLHLKRTCRPSHQELPPHMTP
jgi:hypothetical protein